MKLKRTSPLIIATLLVVFFVINTVPLKTYGQENLRVQNLNTGKNYETIQEAINAANSGNTIYVRNGTYYEHVVVNKTISLVGENKSNTIIDGKGSGNVISVSTNNVNIRGFTIQSSGWTITQSSVYVYHSSGNKISDNIVRNNLYGIHLYYSGENTVVNNTILDNRYGVSLTSATNNVVSNNNFSNNPDGIWLSFSPYNTFSRNNISSSTFNAVSLSTSTDNVFSNNTVLNNNYGFHLTFCGYNTFSNNNVSKNEQGFSLSGSSYNTISENNICCNTVCGVWLGASSDNVFVNNIVVNNRESFHLETSEDNTIYHNNFVNTEADTTQQPSCFDSINFWDNGVEGNYWSSHNGADENRDGISDEVYIVDEKNIDNYPLMANFTQFKIIVDNKVYAIDVVSNSTISTLQYFRYPANGTAVLTFQVNNTGEKGFCRIGVSHTLIEPPYTVVFDHNASLYSRMVHSNGTHSWLYFMYYYPEYKLIIITVSSQELPIWYQLWFWTVIGLMVVTIILFLVVIRYRRICSEQKKVIEAYELKMRVREHFGTARAFFETDVKRRKNKIKKFETKYHVKIRPLNNVEDILRMIESKKKEKEKAAN